MSFLQRRKYTSGYSSPLFLEINSKEQLNSIIKSEIMASFETYEIFPLFCINLPLFFTGF
jgi:hypothetical protein